MWICDKYRLLQENRKKKKYLKCFIKQNPRDLRWDCCTSEKRFEVHLNCLNCPYLIPKHRDLSRKEK
mgnify:CR=1 FL=1